MGIRHHQILELIHQDLRKKPIITIRCSMRKCPLLVLGATIVLDLALAGCDKRNDKKPEGDLYNMIYDALDFAIQSSYID